MADNVESASGSGGAVFVAASLTFSGDTAYAPGCFLGILSGSEGSWTFTNIVGGAGAVGAGVQRMTLASDDPAVAALGATGDAAATQGSTGSISAKLRTVTSQLNTGNTSLASIDGKITACNTGAVVLAAGTAAIGKLAANSGVDIGDVDILSIAAGDNNIGNVDIVTVPADPFGANADAASATGSISAKLRFIASTGIPITGTVTVGSHAVTNAGTFAVQVSSAIPGTGATNLGKAEDAAHSSGDTGVMLLAVRNDTPTSLTSDDLDYSAIAVDQYGRVLTATGGTVLHDGADSGSPVKMGARATTSLSGLTLVANADRTDLFAGIDGVQITRPHCNLEGIVTGQATNTDGTSTECIAAQATGIKTYLTTIILANSHATTSCTVDIKDGSTVKMTIPVPANGGAVVNLPVPLPGTAATAWNFDPSAEVSTISCSMVGFKSKV